MSAEASIDDLYRVHAVGLIRFAVLLVGDQTTAEDVVQDAFLGLFRGWRRVRDPGKAVGYLRVAVLNGCRSALRARGRARLLRVQHDPPVWSAEAAAIDGEDRRELLAAVARLPRRQREVLALRYYLGLGEQEIAAALRISRGTVSSTASRALAVLARELGEEQ
jgi:RNA polymerase sigma-70 factor (sigma-E family)